MVQSCANNAHDVVLDLEKKIDSICKGHHLITVQFLKKCFFKIYKMQKFFMNF